LWKKKFFLRIELNGFFKYIVKGWVVGGLIDVVVDAVKTDFGKIAKRLNRKVNK
jgi:hypothetical protein